MNSRITGRQSIGGQQQQVHNVQNKLRGAGSDRIGADRVPEVRARW
jgi:hypothetical protein